MKKILIIDDEPVFGMVTSDKLCDLNYDASSILSSEDAIELIKKNNYDLIITDIRMPGLDGFEVLDFIMTESPSSKVIVATSADGPISYEEYHSLANDYGVDGVFHKLSDDQELTDLVNEIL